MGLHACLRLGAHFDGLLSRPSRNPHTSSHFRASGLDALVMPVVPIMSKCDQARVATPAHLSSRCAPKERPAAPPAPPASALDGTTVPPACLTSSPCTCLLPHADWLPFHRSTGTPGVHQHLGGALPRARTRVFVVDFLFCLFAGSRDFRHDPEPYGL